MSYAFTFGGEFVTPDREAAYRADRLPESAHLAFVTFASSVVLNALFLISDWRFFGSARFLPAVASRLWIVASSLCCCLAAHRQAIDEAGLLRLILVWCVVSIPPCAVLVSPQTDAALVVVFLLPSIFYLILPLPFCWAATSGACCSAACLGGYLSQSPSDSGPRLAIALAMVMTNVLLGLILVRTNRLQRLAWAAGRDEKEANCKLDRSRAALQSLLRAVPAPLVILARDSGEILQANDAAGAYFGQAALHNPALLVRCFPPDVLARLAKDPHSSGPGSESECALALPDGRRRYALLATELAPYGDGEAVLVSILDITDRKNMERQLERLAETDVLTGLPNRAGFFSRAAEEIQRFRRYGRPLAVLMADIDHFKRINDTCGHEAGDRALRAFAERCRSLLRGSDRIGRIGGEEFAALLPETTGTCAVALAERLRAAVALLPSTWGGGSLTVSIGVAAVRPDETSVEPALGRADAALYAAKRAGRNRVLMEGNAA